MATEKPETESPKWWIDESRSIPEERQQPVIPPAITRFYVTARGFEQERARSGLVEVNRKLLAEADPPDGQLSVLNPIGERSPSELLDKIRRSLPLPPGARGVIVDCGRMARVILTGTPFGDRILEFNFNRGEPSFDVWVRGDWKQEIAFRNVNDLHRRARGLIERYLGAKALDEPEFLT
ncbi:MAG: hypothetical protein QOD06_1438 [Candidatus Binatota bacterium]|jgi:hypothetical protein|nr:hypothetical protein [Candidatus Binatota bacterium]